MNPTHEECIIWDWQYNVSGEFQKALMRAISLADEMNLQWIARGYPDHVSGYRRYAHERGWWEMLEKKMPAIPELKLIDETPRSELPLLIGTLKHDYARAYLEEKIKGSI